MGKDRSFKPHESTSKQTKKEKQKILRPTSQEISERKKGLEEIRKQMGE